MQVDIFQSDYYFPPRVDILAPGPNGKPHWGRLGPWVVAVNRAGLIPVDPDAWMVSDWWALRTDWFADVFISFDGLKLFSAGLDRIGGCGADYTFKLLDGRECVMPLGTGTYDEPIPGLLRPDGSVSASAVELAARRGAREIVLCGVDMCGDTYYDGGLCRAVDCDHKGEWAYTPYFNSLIRWIEQQGITITSLSPTALEVETRQ